MPVARQEVLASDSRRAPRHVLKWWREPSVERKKFSFNAINSPNLLHREIEACRLSEIALVKPRDAGLSKKQRKERRMREADAEAKTSRFWVSANTALTTGSLRPVNTQAKRMLSRKK